MSSTKAVPTLTLVSSNPHIHLTKTTCHICLRTYDNPDELGGCFICSAPLCCNCEKHGAHCAGDLRAQMQIVPRNT